MSDWKDKTDPEVNASVADVLNNIDCENSYFDRFFASPRVLDFEGGRFDPCNNAYYAWPIIIENNISIKLRYGMFKNESHCYPIARSGNIWCSDKNALRAAMIVFLKLKGVKP